MARGLGEAAGGQSQGIAVATRTTAGFGVSCTCNAIVWDLGASFAVDANEQHVVVRRGKTIMAGNVTRIRRGRDASTC